MVTQRERLIAAGKRQVLLWLTDQAVDRLKAICTRERTTQQEFIERLIMDYAGPQPAPDSSVIDTAAVDQASRLDGLNEAVTTLASSFGAYFDISEPRFSEIESRLQHLEATINTAPVLPVLLNNSTSSAPGGNKSAGKRPYVCASDAERDKRDKLFIELHNKGMSPSEISKMVKGEGLDIGTRQSNIHDYLKDQGLIPHSSRK